MSQPAPYTPTTDFSQQESNNASGRSTVNTAALDAEFANVETTLDQLCQNIALIQRDDGRLKDLATEIHTLSPEVLNLMGGFQLRGIWAASTAYAVNDLVSNDIYTYVCTTAHTSGLTFDSQYWRQFGFSGGGDAAQAAAAAQVSANNAASSASSASSSASAASASAISASTSANNASSSASAASASASAAGNSATSASNSASAAAVSAANLPNATTAGADMFLKSNNGGTAWEYQTATQARASLGLIIGTNVQAYNATLAAIASGSMAVGHAIGEIFDYAGDTPPAGSLVCPVAPSNVSRTTYSALFAKIGTRWGAGDGSTTFGLPYFPEGYTSVNTAGTVGTATTGSVKAHTHTNGFSGQVLASGGGSYYAGSSSATGSTGGSANYPAGMSVLKCVQYM